MIAHSNVNLYQLIFAKRSLHKYLIKIEATATAAGTLSSAVCIAFELSNYKKKK